jgi:hypothetical protein
MAELFTCVGLFTAVLLGVARWWEEQQLPQQRPQRTESQAPVADRVLVSS